MILILNDYKPPFILYLQPTKLTPILYAISMIITSEKEKNTIHEQNKNTFVY